MSKHRTIIVIAVLILTGLVSARYAAFKLSILYEDQRSLLVQDRYGEIVKSSQNKRGLNTEYLETVPREIQKALLAKEDRFFYYHPGINPISIIRDAISSVFLGKRTGSSTLTQQLAKNLLGNENDRTAFNKIKEAIYAISLELFTNKEKILLMYANTAYFGKQVQGIGQASRYYFGKHANKLTEREISSLLATLSNPSIRYPGTDNNTRYIDEVSKNTPAPASPYSAPKNFGSDGFSAFEISSFPIDCPKICMLTIDKKLTENLRNILYRNLSSGTLSSVQNGAIVVIKVPENELLAIVGSPDPRGTEHGYQINMAVQPRPIGSTIKPFIYLKAFEKGARPYTEVLDREYAYSIGTGFPFYPKNYDGLYRGIVSLHSALSNSLNVPSVKVLEYVTTNSFAEFLKNSLRFKPIQPLESYDLGIALGSLEMDLLTLSHYFTIFPNQGQFRPLSVARGARYTPPMETTASSTTLVSDKRYIQLVTKILNDRSTGVDQFGLASNLNLPFKNYALKTGTSRDYHDSWTISYTPDFVLGVWLGNSDNTAMHHVSGQSGAGKIWHEAMQIMMNSSYNKQKDFSFDSIEEYRDDGTLEYGLPGDDYITAKKLLTEKVSHITSPHGDDVILLERTTAIPLESNESARWFVNKKEIGVGRRIEWRPREAGKHEIKAIGSSWSETITIQIAPSL